VVSNLRGTYRAIDGILEMEGKLEGRAVRTEMAWEGVTGNKRKKGK
jgi:hypothetical protein